MNKLRLCLFLAACSFALGQDNSDLFEKAPPPIDEALRARVSQFYTAYIAGKFREAYSMVADEAQDAFMASPKQQYRGCEIVKINYSENFTKASVVESCKGEWRFHGQSTPMTIPLTSNWKVINDQWFWYLVKPTRIQSPFSPTGYINVPPEQPDSGNAPPRRVLPPDMAAVARSILAQVSVDKTAVHLRTSETSKDEVRVRNQTPGSVSFYFDVLPVPGFKITPMKADLTTNQETVVVFEYRLDDATIACGECAKKVKAPMTAQLHIQPTGQTFPITVTFTDEHGASKQ